MCLFSNDGFKASASETGLLAIGSGTIKSSGAELKTIPWPIILDHDRLPCLLLRRRGETMKIVILWLLLGLAGCTFVQPMYISPKERGALNKKIFEINAPFDTVWRSLIEYSPRKYFSIKDANKDSGLLTLLFGSRQPGRYVDCGTKYAKNLKDRWPLLAVIKTTAVVEFLGTMNLLVKSIDSSKTSVTINTSYRLNIKDGNLPEQTWHFDTNGKQSKRLGGLEVTCRSTYYAENDIIGGIHSVARGH